MSLFLQVTNLCVFKLYRLHELIDVYYFPVNLFLGIFAILFHRYENYFLKAGKINISTECLKIQLNVKI